MRKTGLIISLQGVREQDINTIGAKALSLARMNRIGLAVPPGFCITASAYREHVRTNKLEPTIENTLDELTNARAEDKQSILSNIRKTIIRH